MARAAGYDEAERAALTAARRVAGRLLRSALGQGVPLRVDADASRGWWRLLLGRLPRGLQLNARGPALAIGCAWALAEASALLARRARGLDVAAVVDLVTAAPPRARASGWRGYARVPGGWVSIALAAGERDLWERFAASIGEDGRAREPAAIASAAQEWGLACLAAPPARREWPSTTGDRPIPLPLDPARLGLVGDDRPLEGLRAVDAGALVSAPLAGALLAALGANVVAIAHPSRVSSRWYGPPAEAMDLGLPGPRRRFAELCAGADVVIDNFSPRVWPNLGLDPLALGARSQVSLPAFPVGDVRRGHRAFGFQTEALLGVGCAPPRAACGPLPAPRAAIMDHAVGFAAAAFCLGAILQGGSGRAEVSHVDVAALGA